ncbi:MAG: glycosyltransferase family 4 protein [Flavobacterium sp.]|uniref:glycosyltransferase family 4 protein n=1 Tax=Flavobacterium sp. TaxID=239 RepID=UPI002629735D|nr:glycosyltransferase family 4 protein [Flavobacterium sp.]MDD5149117.1 glycosyltransferase family 4 protein [Flavobacterium sp.]
MKKLKIVQTPARFYPYIGGVENYALALSRELIKQDNKVKIICAKEPNLNVENHEGIKIDKLTYFEKIANTNITLGLPIKLLKEDFDIIHSYLPTPWSLDISALIAKIKNKKLIITYCNDIYSKEDGFLRRIITWLYGNTFLKLNLYLADKIIIIQPNYINYSNYLAPYRNKIIFIPPGVDINKFKKIKIRKIKNQIFFLSILDEYHRYKGLDYLLEALKVVKIKIPNIKLIIGGKGKLLEEYKRIIEQNNLTKNVQFLGFVQDKDLIKYYNQSQIFVLPSINNKEGFGMVLTEALACEVPVISTSIVGVAEDIKSNNCGIIVQPKNSQALANSIIQLLKNPNLLKKMGRNGRRLISKKYSWENVASIIKKIYYGAFIQ